MAWTRPTVEDIDGEKYSLINLAEDKTEGDLFQLGRDLAIQDGTTKHFSPTSRNANGSVLCLST